jgi:drug/metabolite transporter (DMT)-like permease
VNSDLRKPVFLLFLTSVLWGASFVAGKIALAHMAPASAAFWRFALGTATLVPIWLWKGGPAVLPRRARDYGGLVVLGIFGIFGYNWFFFQGLQHVEPGAAALVVTTNPALTAIVSALLLRETLSPLKTLGFLLAAAGALVVLTGGVLGNLLTLRFGPGSGLLALAVLSWVAYVVLGRVVMATVSPLTATTAAFVVGLPLLAAAAAAEGSLTLSMHAPPGAWAAITFMGVLCSGLAFLWFYEGVSVLGAARASVFIYLVPGFALLTSHWVLGESLTAAKLAGGGLVLLGVALTSLPSRSRA